MFRFIKFIFLLFTIIVLTLVFLDVIYTFAKIKSNPRNKIEYIIDSKNQKFDIVILGSSRAENHLVSDVFVKRGYKTFNFGMSGSQLDENLLELKLMLESNYKIKNIILQTDINLEGNSYSEGSRAPFMPFLHYSKTIRNHYKNIQNYNKFLYLPFYRYLYYDAKIGFREFFFTSIQKKTNFLDANGFDGLKPTHTRIICHTSTAIPKKNFAYEQIKLICKRQKINLISITTPMYNGYNNLFFKELKKIYPEIKDFHSIINEEKYFTNCGHMNSIGAKLFTETVFDSIKLKR